MVSWFNLRVNEYIIVTTSRIMFHKTWKVNFFRIGQVLQLSDILRFINSLDIMERFFCECFSNSMEIFTKKSRICKKYCNFTKV